MTAGAAGRDSEAPPDWCDATLSLLQRPEAKRIEEHAVQLLCRALDVRPIVAFVGAGASMAYGRISWRDAVVAMQRDTIAEAEKKLKESGSNPSWKPMLDLLQQHEIKPGDLRSGTDFLVAFQLAEQLDRAMNVNKFREKTEALLADDYGHAKHIVASARASMPNAQPLGDNQKILPRRDASNHRNDIRTIKYARRLRQNLDHTNLAADEKDLADKLIELISYKKNEKKDITYTYPYHRFVVGALLRLARSSEEYSKVLGAPVWDESPIDRATLIPRERDPLRILYQMQINRFMTTNFDREIERLFEEEGLRYHDPGSALRELASGDTQQVDQLGLAWKDLVFDRDHVGHLLSFAARDGRRLAEVVHLHGRAERVALAKRRGRITVTTQDYQARYLSSDDRRSGMEDALLTAFGGNPILFVGSGMGEDDLLRPLRQFLGDKAPNSGRLAVALVPAERGSQETGIEKITHLQRYGVYTIHYGNGWRDTEPGADAQKIPWLAGLVLLREKIEDVLSMLRDGLPKEDIEREKWFTKFEKRQKSLDDDFTPLSEQDAPNILEGIRSGAFPALDIEQEWELIKLAGKFALNKKYQSDFLQKNGDYPDLKRIQQMADVYQYIMVGCVDSIMGAFLCARLLRLRGELSDWRERWQRLPEAENPDTTIEFFLRDVAKELVRPKSIDDPNTHKNTTENTSESWQRRPEALFCRHTVHLSDVKELYRRHKLKQKPSTTEGAHDLRHRFYAGAPSQTFNHLLAALEEDRHNLRRPPNGQRLFLFLARRGVGKGHFFSALSGAQRLAEFRNLIGDQKCEWPAAFFNTGLSLDVSSVFDLLGSFLLRAAKICMEIEKELHPDLVQSMVLTKLEEEAKHPRLGRLGRLKLILTRLAEDKTKKAMGGRRIIVGINGLSILFDRGGKAKNAQAGRLFDLLTGDVGQKAPIDLILVTREQNMPAAFRATERQQKTESASAASQAPLKGATDGKDGKAEPYGFHLLPQEFREWRDEQRRNRRKNNIKLRNIERTDKYHRYVHFLHQTRAVVMATAFFPSVALVVALDELSELLHRDDERGAEDLAEKVSGNLFKAGNAHRIRLMIPRAIISPGGKDEKYAQRIAFAKQNFPLFLAWSALSATSRKSTPSLEPWKMRFSHWENLKSLLNDKNISFDVLEKESEKEKERILQELPNNIDQRMKLLFELCNEARFLFTVLMATAFQHMLSVAESSKLKGESAPVVGKAIRRCARFLSDVTTRVEGRPLPLRSELILQQCMRELEEIDTAPGAILPGGTDQFIKAGRSAFSLQRVLLWQLSVIGQPVLAEVLARTPVVKRYAADALKNGQLPDDGQPPDEGKIKGAVQDGLNLLEQRCLVFRIRARDAPARRGPSDVEKPRYAVHRFVQRYVLRRLHSPFVEFAETDQFAITLYGSQPNDVPRLTSEAHRELQDTVAAMIGYPEAGHDAVEPRCWPPTPPEGEVSVEMLRLRAQMLRAAFGMIRSVYSLATILRLAPTATAEEEVTNAPPGFARGVLEEHRLRVRWLILQAEALDGDYDRLRQRSGGGLSDDPNKRETRPFYTEEIAWLYNECGVLDQTQGRTHQALAMFDRAEAAAQRFEPHRDGAISVRISLNRASVDIDRGSLRLAERALNRIVKIEDEHEAITLLADGLLGLVEHTRGKYESAEQHYRRALYGDEKRFKGLIAIGRSRAAAIFARHYGDLERKRENWRESEELLASSLTLALDGGHEDIRHAAHVSRLTLLFRQGKSSTKDLHKQLDVIEDYARLMSIPRLQCEVDLLRTFLHQNGGDLRAAATAASRGLTLSIANGLRLRKTGFLIRLTEIFRDRGHLEECQPLLAEAFDIARDTDYHTARNDAQTLYASIVPRTF